MRTLKIIALLSCITLAGCVTNSQVYSFNFDKDKGKEKETGDFVKLTNGGVVKGEIKRSKPGIGLLDRNSVTMVDGTVYEAKNIDEYQADSIFYKKIPGSKKLFYFRRKSGKINLYARYYAESGTDSRGRMYRTQYEMYWLQKGKDTPLQKFSVNLLESMVSDSNEANTYMQEYKNKSSKKRKDSDIDKIIDVYNGKA